MNEQEQTVSVGSDAGVRLSDVADETRVWIPGYNGDTEGIVKEHIGANVRIEYRAFHGLEDCYIPNFERVRLQPNTSIARPATNEEK